MRAKQQAEGLAGLSVRRSAGPDVGSRPAIRILIADDHPIFREGLARILHAEPGFAIVGSAKDGDEAVTLAGEVKPDVVLLGLARPEAGGGLEGLELLGRITRHAPAVRVIVLASAVDRRQMVEAVRHGARGIVLKACAIDLLYKSIRCVMAGEYWVGRDTVSDLVRALVERPAPASGQLKAGPRALTPRERDILSRLMAGRTNKEIARGLSVTEDTVKHHLTSIFGKTGVSNRLALALYAVNHRLVDAA